MNNFDEMICKVKKEIESFKGTCGVIIKNESTGQCFKHNEGEVFPSASVIKLSILLELFRKVDAKEIILEDRIALKESDKIGGFGILKELDENLNLTIKDLATLMTILSDNVATNKLIDIVGMDPINNTLKKLEMKNTIIVRKMMDRETKKRGLDNYTSPNDTLTILEIFLNASESIELSDDSRKTIIEILKKQQCNNKLPLLMPKGVCFAHKTGDLPGVEHDVGILFSQAGNIIVIVLTKDLEDNREGVKLNNIIGKIIAEY